MPTIEAHAKFQLSRMSDNRIADGEASLVGPRTCAEEEAARAEPPARDILVVDDDAANLTAIEVALGELGRRLVTAESGRDALRHLLLQDFALILLDVQMPGMDGFETAELIRSRERSRHVPIIFITAYSRDDGDVLRGYALGAVDFMFKPIVPEVLKAKASVFVALQDRTSEVRRQAQRLHEMEQRESLRRLDEERQRWEADRLRSEGRRKDEFLAILAHELRNPLASIVGGLSVMHEIGLPDGPFEMAHASMARQSTQLSRLVDDLLDVSRISRGKIALAVETFDFRDSVERAIDAHRHSIEKRAQTLRLRLPANPCVVEGDRTRLTQVVSNLLHNAVRYTPVGGSLDLSLELEADFARLTIRDDGRGIAQEMLERIFDLFSQERPDGDGLGLGLTVASRLVEMHGGEITATSAGLGTGSEFVVRVPRTGAESWMEPQERWLPRGRKKNGAHRLRIALVDDDQDVRSLLKTLLETWGHEVEVAEDGRRGVDLVVERRPDVVLMDVGMPGMDGYEAARQIREQLREATPRMIAMTGFGGHAHRERAHQAGFDAHLVKPAYPDDLMAVLSESSK